MEQAALSQAQLQGHDQKPVQFWASIHLDHPERNTYPDRYRFTM